MMEWLRQQRQPREFRIPPPQWPPALADQLAQVAQALAEATPPRELPEPPVVDHPLEAPRATAGLDDRQLGAVATRLLLLKRLLDRADDLSGPTTRARRHVEAIWDALVDGGVEIIDHTDQPYIAGMKLKVHSWQPTPGLTQEMIAETTKPSVYLHGELIQLGEVHVAVPEQ
jgi:hypothetical protein